MNNTLIKGATIVNEGTSFVGSVLISGSRIEAVFKESEPHGLSENVRIVDAKGLLLLPGMIDDQVHFREPGLTHKAEIKTESIAAVAGGITSYMEMPNTLPQTITQAELEKKFQRASEVSLANYSFYIGATNNNLDEVLATDPNNVCGVKAFMGSSTGNMLVDNPVTLEKLFSSCKLLIATHCEDEKIIRENARVYKARYGENVPMSAHPLIRSREACLASSSYAVGLAKKHDTRLHVLHISTAEECALFDNNRPSDQKRVTAEACVHHLWFTEDDYEHKGTFIKWNPAVKSASDRDAVTQAVVDGRIDILATDHAPHTLEEKSRSYWEAPSGGPLVQHALQAYFELCTQGKFSIELVVERFAHAPARCYQIRDRGFIRPGYYADLVLLDPNAPCEVTRSNLLYKCGWSPFEGFTFSSSVRCTWVNGSLVYDNGVINDSIRGMSLTFSR